VAMTIKEREQCKGLLWGTSRANEGFAALKFLRNIAVLD
jgi:hypothetical protein